ncbi:ribonuclease [Sinorhizobium sp. BG8]|uniref:ribonuclease T2 family protein n=1 Tax=Sinorhizobium sp. BG8 TaxID=2613773 RepID=UPI00193D4778|nr:ribonuclease [Sinorhizobium sp. BG8]QRM56020.1 ribonuclease [Sinorhizobium sp. BG8]
MKTKTAIAVLFGIQTAFLPLLAAAAEETHPAAGGTDGTRQVLSITWQPGFCETRRNRPECADNSAGTSESTGFSLHGLWQLKKGYCGIDAELKKRDSSGKWTELPPLTLSHATAKRLEVAMPGVKSGLDRHQWLRNGTCSATTAEAYYLRSLDLLDAVNASPVRSLFERKAGGEVTATEIRTAFDEAFGSGAGERVRITCRKAGERLLVIGLTIGLSSADDTETDLAGLIHGASSTEPKCGSGHVMAAGLD